MNKGNIYMIELNVENHSKTLSTISSGRHAHITLNFH